MSNMDEMILVVERTDLFDGKKLEGQGLLTDKNWIRHINKRFMLCREMRRGDAEIDASVKQPIPYLVIRRGAEIFITRRLKGSGEKKLHNMLSIGVGGHMNRVEGLTFNWDAILMHNLVRELNEEVCLTTSNPEGISVEPEIIGLINDDSTDVGRFHIGILMLVDLPMDAEVTVRETDKLDGYWMPTKELHDSTIFDSLESWSQMALEVL